MVLLSQLSVPFSWLDVSSQQELWVTCASTADSHVTDGMEMHLSSALVVILCCSKDFFPLSPPMPSVGSLGPLSGPSVCMTWQHHPLLSSVFSSLAHFYLYPGWAVLGVTGVRLVTKLCFSASPDAYLGLLQTVSYAPATHPSPSPPTPLALVRYPPAAMSACVCSNPPVHTCFLGKTHDSCRGPGWDWVGNRTIWRTHTWSSWSHLQLEQ